MQRLIRMMRWNSQKSQHRLIEKLQESMIFILFSVEKDLNWSHGILIKKQEIKKTEKG